MQKLRQKRPRLKLSAEKYDLLRHRVLARDGWRCQNCGSSKDLHVHHQTKRSGLGDDALGQPDHTLCDLPSARAPCSDHSSQCFLMTPMVRLSRAADAWAREVCIDRAERFEDLVMRLPNHNQVAFFGEPGEPLQPIEARSPEWSKSVRVPATVLVIRLRLASGSSRFGVHCLAKHMNTHYLCDFGALQILEALYIIYSKCLEPPVGPPIRLRLFASRNTVAPRLPWICSRHSYEPQTRRKFVCALCRTENYNLWTANP
jgi:hypothetical protein